MATRKGGRRVMRRGVSRRRTIRRSSRGTSYGFGRAYRSAKKTLIGV